MNLVVGIPLILQSFCGFPLIAGMAEELEKDIERSSRYDYDENPGILQMGSKAAIIISIALASFAVLALGTACILTPGLSLGKMLVTAGTKAIWPLLASVVLFPPVTCYAFLVAVDK